MLSFASSTRPAKAKRPRDEGVMRDLAQRYEYTPRPALSNHLKVRRPLLVSSSIERGPIWGTMGAPSPQERKLVR